MPFQSRYNDITVPHDITVWEYAFENARYSPLMRSPGEQMAGFVNAQTGQRLSYRDVKTHASHLCTALVRNCGLRVGHTMTIFSPNSIWYPVAMFAVLKAGGRVNGASPSYSAQEMAHALRTAGTDFIVTIPEALPTVMEAAEAVKLPRNRILLLEGEAAGLTTIESLRRDGERYGTDAQHDFHRIQRGSNGDLCGFLAFSSGTTGLPKAVMLSHRNMISQCEQLRDVAGHHRKTFLASLPCFHISGLVRFLNWPIISNEEVIMLSKFTMEAFLQAIQKYRVTDLTLVPSIVVRLVRDSQVSKYDLSSVKVIACGAAPVGQEILTELQRQMPWTGFRQSWGMTESCCSLTTHPPEFYDYKYANNAGMLIASTIVKVQDLATGKELGPGETGELFAKGPQVAMGYLDNPEETAATFQSDGYLRTGDVGRVDEMGFVHIVDRLKEMIKVKGLQVAPAELEDTLLASPDVDDCAVLGISDETTERPKAYVVLKAGIEPNEAVGRRVMQFVKDRKIAYKWLEEVEFTDVIPKSPSGKILRRVLQDQHRGGRRGVVVVARPSAVPKL
ncbi:hypothetical protein CERZMDRAFT_113583 [Cercospora zeae-maydis SCOH1-5]|uniref:AMP-dependent synthetase/ligase domain-containing protein n=1 Tax=Cercospora zeae-maydis SCOH1-5 TaxID=717836 RepID=A0A6A6F8V1_9PEZI|nr:hypothetical protein CERZMDRAFT_113583 [Cercospora zeae-maydis SCOH1-5]